MPEHTAYALVNGETDGWYEYHVHCRLAPGQHLEFVSPDGDVAATWPPGPAPTDDVIAHGTRFYHRRGDLSVRLADDPGDDTAT